MGPILKPAPSKHILVISSGLNCIGIKTNSDIVLGLSRGYSAAGTCCWLLTPF